MKNEVEINKILKTFDLALPDGFPVAKASSILYKNKQKRVDGYKIFNETVKKGLDLNTSHYFYGNSEEVIVKLISELKANYPNINISGYNCPPIGNEDELSSIYYEELISRQNPDIVWISLGFPKQEKVIDNFVKSKNITSNLVGIGFAIEWVAGTKKKAPEFLANIGKLDQTSKTAMEAPLDKETLKEVVKELPKQKSPGLDGLTYEFYKETFDVIGDTLLIVLNGVLEEGGLEHGVTRVLSKVDLTPSVLELRPITLLCCDYKIGTKCLAQRVVPVMPQIIKSGQLCSVDGRNILFGATNLISAIEYINQNNLSTASVYATY